MRSDNRRFLRALGGFSVKTLGVVDLSADFKGRVVELREVPVIEDSSHSLILGQDWVEAMGEVRIAYKHGLVSG